MVTGSRTKRDMIDRWAIRVDSIAHFSAHTESPSRIRRHASASPSTSTRAHPIAANRFDMEAMCTRATSWATPVRLTCSSFVGPTCGYPGEQRMFASQSSDRRPAGPAMSRSTR